MKQLDDAVQKIQADAVINFAFFTANFPYDFIDKCWEGHHLKDHIKDKLRSSDGVYTSTGDVIKFFFDLDDEHRRRLIKWINENYKAWSYLEV